MTLTKAVKSCYRAFARSERDLQKKNKTENKQKRHKKKRKDKSIKRQSKEGRDGNEVMMVGKDEILAKRQ